MIKNSFRGQEGKYFYLTVLVGIIVMLPTLLGGIPVGADFDNHFRFVLPFYEEIAKGNLIPTWLAESNSGLGDLRFRVYPPLIYYLLCLFKIITNDWYLATIVTFTFSSVVGSLGVYFWTKQTLSNQTSFLSAVIFAILPYHLTQFFQASLLAEYWAMSLIPYSFLFIERIFDKEKNTDLSQIIFNVFCMGILFSLIIISHIPTTVITSLSLGLYSLLLVDWKHYKKALLHSVLGIFSALILSSWFWVKVLTELRLIQAGINVSSQYYDYRNNFIFSPFSLDNLNVWFANVNVVLNIGLFLPVLLILWRILTKNPTDLMSKFFLDGNKKFKDRLFASLVLAFLTFLMMTDLSRPLWLFIPKLKDIQFPFRWLTITSIIICPMIALSIQVWVERIKKNNLRISYFVLPLGFLFAFTYSIYDLVIYSDYINRQAFSEKLEKIRGSRSFTDWLPVGAKELKDITPIKEDVEAGIRQVKINNWESERRNFSISAGDESEVKVKTYFYPLWHAFRIDNGEKMPLPLSKDKDGIMTISIPSNALNIELLIVENKIVSFFSWISAIGWITVNILIIFALSRRRIN